VGLEGVREAARKGRDVRLIMHHITPELLAESFEI
jgi:hypothetical protein